MKGNMTPIYIGRAEALGWIPFFPFRRASFSSPLASMHAIPVTHASHGGRLRTWYSRRSRFSWRPPPLARQQRRRFRRSRSSGGRSCQRRRPRGGPAAACGGGRWAPPQLVDNAEGFVAPTPQAAAAVCGGGRGSSATLKVSSLTLLRRPLPLPRPCAVRSFDVLVSSNQICDVWMGQNRTHGQTNKQTH